MLGGRPGALVVLHRHAVAARHFPAGVQQHHGHAPADTFDDVDGVLVRGHHDQAVDAAQHGAAGLQHVVAAGMAAGKKGLVLVQAGLAVDTADYFGVKIPEKIRQHDTENMVVSGAEALGGAVGPVIQAFGGLQDFFGRG